MTGSSGAGGLSSGGGGTGQQLPDDLKRRHRSSQSDDSKSAKKVPYRLQPGLRIRIALMRLHPDQAFHFMRIRIQFFISMRIRIQLFISKRIRIQLFTLMRIRIQLFTIMRIRIQLFTSVQIRIWILLLLLIKVLGIFDRPLVYRPSRCFIFSLQAPFWAYAALVWASEAFEFWLQCRSGSNFHSIADSDPAFKNNVYPCGSGSVSLITVR